MPIRSRVRKGVQKETKVVEQKAIKGTSKDAEDNAAGGGAGDASGVPNDDDEAIAAFFQEMKQDDSAKAHVIRKVSKVNGMLQFRLGPDYIDEDYFECTPYPLYQQTVPMIDFRYYLERTPEEILVVTPIRPQTFSALFTMYRDRGPALNWDPHLTDLEEDCFFQEVINFPTSKLAYAIPRERKRDLIPKKRVKVFKPNGDYVIKTRLSITLQESPTIMLLNLTGSLILESDEKFALAQESNEKYLLMVKHHLESDSYANDYAQTFENYKLSKYSDYKISGCIDRGTECHNYYIDDEYKKVEVDDIKRKIKDNDEATALALAEKARQEIPETGWKSSDESDDSSDDDNDLLNRVDISRYKEEDEEDMNRQIILEDASEDELPMSEDDEEFEIHCPLASVYEKRKRQMKNRGPRIYPDISFSMIALERIICMDATQQKQADMRGFSEPEVVKIKVVVHEEDADKAEALDEDTVVDLLIQQHRLQEQVENAENEETLDDNAVVMAPETTLAEMEQIKAELADGDGEEDEEEADEAAKKKEEVKVEEVIVEDPEEKDEFDLVLEGLLPETKDDRSGLKETDGRKDRGEVLVDDETGKDSKEKREEDFSTDRTDKRAGPGIIAEESRGGPLGRTVLSTGDGTEISLGGIRCEWDDRAEKATDAQEDFEEGLALEDIVEEEKIILPEATEEDDSELARKSNDEHHHHHHHHHKASTQFSDKKELVAELGYQFAELKEKEDKTPNPPEEDDEQPIPEEEDVEDDISESTEYDEDSRLSDHKGLGSESSEWSDAYDVDDVSIFKELVRSRSSAAKLFGPPRENNEEDQPLHTDGPYLKQFWQLKCPLTTGKEVTDIALHPSNGNIIAASYGTFQFGKESDPGLVCVWNAKNDRSPERFYHLKSPATTLAFSEFTPYLLAVGCLDGNIVLYDVRESDSIILGNTFTQEDRHLGPVWQIYWLVEVDSTNEESISESMLSLGDEGYLKKWSLTKGMESNVVMKVMRSTMQIPGRREKRSESLITTLSTAYTVCFFPNNATLFLLGTEEGFIHKCSTAYKDQYVSTYVGHTGPVYRICFSMFDDTVFVSCGGDWTIKIWKTDHATPLLSMQTGHRTVFDVTCSLYSSTVFICCTEFYIEVWDLSLNTLEPVIELKPAVDVAMRRVAFDALLNSIIIGDDEGCLTIYGLRQFPKPKTSKVGQMEALLDALLPGYKRRQKEAEKRGRDPTEPIRVLLRKEGQDNSAFPSNTLMR